VIAIRFNFELELKGVREDAFLFSERGSAIRSSVKGKCVKKIPRSLRSLRSFSWSRCCGSWSRAPAEACSQLLTAENSSNLPVGSLK